MKDNYDFSHAVKNPFAGKIKGKYSVTIHYDFTENLTTRDDDRISARKYAAIKRKK